MKNSLLLSVMLMASYTSFAQNNPIDFEPGGNGADWTWTVFENDDNPPLEIIANPDPSGINMSATVAKVTARENGEAYAGCESDKNADLGPFVLDATNSTIKIMVWKSVISDVGIKLASPMGWAQVEIKVPNTLINQWEEITFNFSNYLNPPVDQGQLSQIIIFPDFGDRNQDNVVFFDNITFSSGGSSPTGPTVAAPAPTQDAANVISLFSHVYTNVPVDTWRTDWSAATLEEVMIEGNATKKYSNLDFVGIETVANQLDITEKTFLHVDVWSSDFTLFAIKLVDFGPDGAFGGGDDTEHQVDINMPAQGEWVSLDIPLSDFVDLTTRENIAQYILVGQPTGATTIYLDNMFFYTGSVTPTGPMAAAPTPTQLPANVISMFSDAYTDVPVDTWRTDWSEATLEDVMIVGNATKKYSDLDFVGIETVNNQLDITEMSFLHVDVWSSDYTLFAIKLVDFGPDGAFGGGDDTEHQVDINMPAQGEWVSLDIPLSDFVDLTTRENIAQYILVGQPTGSTTVYMDNMYFYRTPVNINELNSNTINIYPNPVKAGNEVRLNADVNQIELFDITGKLISTFRNTAITTNSLSEGIYFVKILTKNGNIITQKLVVN